MVLRCFSTLYGLLNEWSKNPLKKMVPRWITPNLVTISRTIMFVPIAVLVLLECNTTALVVHIVASVLDFVDGALARAREECTELGKFMDAVADKAYFCGQIGLLLPLMDYTECSWWQTATILGTGSALAVIEGWLALVRWQDYVHNQNAADSTKMRDLRSIDSGKLKFVFECIGAGAYIVAFPDPTSAWALLGLTAFVLATPFAVQSLQDKLKQR